jgi:hypothetical protein
VNVSYGNSEGSEVVTNLSYTIDDTLLCGSPKSSLATDKDVREFSTNKIQENFSRDDARVFNTKMLVCGGRTHELPRLDNIR